MRIIYLHQYFNTPSMSGGTRSYEMARRLVALGHEVHMVTSCREEVGPGHPGRWHETLEEGIHVHWLANPYSNAMSYRERIRSFLRFAVHSARKASKLNGDIVFATSTPLTIAIPALYAKRTCSIPMVFEVRDLWPEVPIAIGALRNSAMQRLARALERIAYKSSAHIVALSPGMAEGIVRHGVSPSRVTVIPNSCDIDSFLIPSMEGLPIRNTLGLEPKQPLVVYTGTFGLVNNVGYLVHLARYMHGRNPAVRFLLVGGGAESRQIDTLARELNVLNKNLWIWQPLPKIEMPRLLAASTMATSVVLPRKELWNNSANKFFDALAAGKPIAINHEGWQADLLRNSGAGIVLPAEDIGEAAHMLNAFLTNPESLRRAALAARDLALQDFHRDKLATSLERILRRAVDHRLMNDTYGS